MSVSVCAEAKIWVWKEIRDAGRRGMVLSGLFSADAEKILTSDRVRQAGGGGIPGTDILLWLTSGRQSQVRPCPFF